MEKYRPLGHLGAGGMGQVFHGRISFPLHQARSCAIKTIRPDRFDAEEIARFTHEAMIGWDLTGHPNIITTRSFGEWPDGQLYVVLDKEGPCLHDIFPRLRGDFPFIHRIAEHMLNALAYLQSKKVIHGDISAGNILLGRDGQGKLNDFGLSRRADADGNARDHGPLIGGVVGVPAYASPEVLNGGRPTFASDLYSLGAVLHELAAGRAPHGSYNFTEMIIRVQVDPPGPLPDATPDALVQLIRGLTEKDPTRRLTVAQARAILAQSTAPRADEQAIADLCHEWIQAARKKPGLDSPGKTAIDLLDAAAQHISRVQAAEKLGRQLRHDARPGQPERQELTEPDAEPGQHRGPGRRRAVIAALLAMLLAMLLAYQVRQADREPAEITASEERPTVDQESESGDAAAIEDDQDVQEPRVHTRSRMIRHEHATPRRARRGQGPVAIQTFNLHDQTDWDFPTRVGEKRAP